MKRQRGAAGKGIVRYIQCDAHPRWQFRLPALGAGNDGAIYVACRDREGTCPFVGKVIVDRPQFYHERRVMSVLNGDSDALALAPRMYDSFECANFVPGMLTDRTVGVIIMENMDKTMYDAIEDKTVDALDAFPTYLELIKALHMRHNIAHRDAHMDNVMYKKDRLYLVDFGRAKLNATQRDRELDMEVAAYMYAATLAFDPSSKRTVFSQDVRDYVLEMMHVTFPDYTPFKKGIHDPRPFWEYDWDKENDDKKASITYAPQPPETQRPKSPPSKARRKWSPGFSLLLEQPGDDLPPPRVPMVISPPPPPGERGPMTAAFDAQFDAMDDWGLDVFHVSGPSDVGRRARGRKGRARRRKRRGGHVSRAKARKILKHGKIHGKPLTAKQRRYFGWLSSRGQLLALGEHEQIDGGAFQDEHTRQRVLVLLNTRGTQETQEAIEVLKRTLAPNVDVDVTFDLCTDKAPAANYLPYRTGSANAHHIRLCDDIRGQKFAHDYPTSNTIRHDPNKTTHYAVIVLHEFGHVLDKNDVLDDIVPGLPERAGPNERNDPNDVNNEERADLFAQWFLGGASVGSILNDELGTYKPPPEYSIEVRKKVPGDLYHGQGSALGYAITCFEKCKRPRALQLMHGKVYQLRPRGDWRKHPMALSTTPKGGRDDAREAHNMVRHADPTTGVLTIDTSTLDRTRLYHLVCTYHDYMGFPIRIWIAERVVSNKLIEGKRGREETERYFSCTAHPDWQLDTLSFLERGAQGSVYVACTRGNCLYAAKVVRLGAARRDAARRDFDNEVRMFRYLETGVSTGKPRVSARFYDAFKCTLHRDAFGHPKGAQIGVIVLEKLHQTLFERLEGGTHELEFKGFKDSVQLVQTLHQHYDMTHNDAHTRNVMYRQDGTMVLIDFSFAKINPGAWQKMRELYNMYEEDDYDYLTQNEADAIVRNMLGPN